MIAALTRLDDKHGDSRAAAAAATEQIVDCTDAFAFEALIPVLIASLDIKRSPLMKLHALRLSGRYRRELRRPLRGVKAF